MFSHDILNKDDWRRFMKRRHLFISGGILLVCFIIGSFLDLNISQAIFSKNNGFGIFMSAFATIPGYGLLSFLGGVLFALTLKNKEQKTWLRITLFVCAFIGLISGTYFSGDEIFSVNAYNKENLTYLGMIICGIINLGIFAAGMWFAKFNKQKNMWLMIVLILLGVAFISLVPGVTLLKNIFHRPRYRIAVYEGYVDFHNWWEPCKEYKTLMDTFSLAKEEFKSFPSGHGGASMLFAVLLSFLPLINQKLMKYQTPLFYVGFSWNLLTSFSRILVGAHFLSDVAMGSLLVLICYYIVNEIIVKKLFVVEEKEAC